MEGGDGNENSFTSAMTLTQLGVAHVPECYALPPPQRPNPTTLEYPSTTFPIIDLSSLQHPSLRSQMIHEIRIACKETGFFQVFACITYPS